MVEETRTSDERTTRKALYVLVAAMVCAAIAVGLVAGCTQSSSTSGSTGGNASAVHAGLSQDLLAFAIDNLDRLEEYNNERAIGEIVNRLNDWIELQKVDDAWQVDPVVGSLPAEFRQLDVMRSLSRLEFTPYDGSYLQESVWMRNISRVARGDSADPVAQATSIFDWVVRNVQLDADTGEKTPRLAFQSLLVGHGDAIDRAWIFLLLARQQNLDVVLLALPAADGSGKLEPWLPALVEGDDLYLFDTRLGLPIPGPQGPGSVATLSEVATDDALLRRLDLDDEHRYPIGADRLAQVVALIETSPLALSRRMQLFESHMGGDSRLALSVDATDLLERVWAVPHVTDARLWTHPYEILLAQSSMDRAQQMALLAELSPFFEVRVPRTQIMPLWQGRLHHFKGDFDGEQSANVYYQMARPADADLEAMEPKPSPEMMAVFLAAKRNASYWLGLVAYERGLYGPAIEHLRKRTLEATPSGPWTYGARYNLARSYEALGQLEEAMRLYDEDTSPQQHGNRLRAKWLAETLAPSVPDNGKNDDDASADGSQDESAEPPS